jgi:AcrR family transcriptional regulator
MSRMSRREVQARETQQVILDAALSLFISVGYGATSVAEIAEKAGVAVPTIYASVGPKPVLLQRLVDRIDELADIPMQAAGLLASNDPADVLSRQVTLTRTLAENCGDVIAALASAAGVEAEMAAVYQQGLARHRAGVEKTVNRIVELGGLRPTVTSERAMGILATLTDQTVYRRLCGTHGWTFDEVEEWLRETLRHQLIAARPRGSLARDSKKPRR